jgi:hypothetical protein
MMIIIIIIIILIIIIIMYSILYVAVGKFHPGPNMKFHENPFGEKRSVPRLQI